MNGVPRGAIVKGRVLSYANRTVFEGYDLPYPIRAVRSCSYFAELSKVGDYDHARFSIKADLTLIDAVDGALFEKKVDLREDCDIMKEMNEDGEGYLVSGSLIDLDDLALRIIISSLPIKATRPGSVLPRGGEGYRILSEEEKAAEKRGSRNPAFDKLKDFDVGK
ncbi:MAG: DUF177 domain-containing protein [Bacilli bacterium]|jgi:hypothetical protein|nr:DUF177 domain-containing protein [Bacilli bacterium]